MVVAMSEWSYVTVFDRALTKREMRAIRRYMRRYYGDQTLSVWVFVAAVLGSFALAVAAVLWGAP